MPDAATFDNGLDVDQEIEISIDQRAIAQLLAANPDFIRAIALQVRDQLTRDVRRIGNTYDRWAQKREPQTVQPQNPGTRRLT